jgi:hypothetical protein
MYISKTINSDSNQVIGFNVLIRGGSNYETKQNNGISHLLEHLIVKKIQQVDGWVRPYYIDQLVGVTYKDRIEFEGRILATDKDQLEDIVKTIFSNVEFTKEEFDDVLGFAAPAAQVAAPAVTPAAVAPVAMPAPVVSAPVVAPVAPAPVAPAPASHDAIASQIAELQRLQAQLAAQTAVPAPVVAPMPPVQVDAPVVAPAPVVPPQPEPVVQAPVSMPTPAPVVAAPTVAAPTAAVDDSLASILAELQAKINAQQAPGSTTGQAN